MLINTRKLRRSCITRNPYTITRIVDNNCRKSSIWCHRNINWHIILSVIRVKYIISVQITLGSTTRFFVTNRSVIRIVIIFCIVCHVKRKSFNYNWIVTYITQWRCSESYSNPLAYRTIHTNCSYYKIISFTWVNIFKLNIAFSSVITHFRIRFNFSINISY